MKETSKKLFLLSVTGVWTGCYGGSWKGMSLMCCDDGKRHGNKLLQRAMTVDMLLWREWHGNRLLQKVLTG
jgi:hypothetical protein